MNYMPAAGPFEISFTKCPKWLRVANRVELLVTFSTSAKFETENISITVFISPL